MGAEMGRAGAAGHHSHWHESTFASAEADDLNTLDLLFLRPVQSVEHASVVTVPGPAQKQFVSFDCTSTRALEKPVFVHISLHDASGFAADPEEPDEPSSSSLEQAEDASTRREQRATAAR